tara:strand:- start:253 stop:693 length:441 start_codon:yes stop_codon:yes gene_type:complete
MFISAGNACYGLNISDIPYAVYAGKDRTQRRGLHFIGRTTPLYIDVNNGTRELEIIMSSDSTPGKGGETAAAILYDPKGRMVKKLSTVPSPIDNMKINNPMSGCWKFKFIKPKAGKVDDVYVIVSGKGMSGFVSLNPQKLLSVRKD